MKYKLKTHTRKQISDILTPVSIYLRLRDHFPNSLLLESSDYHANDNSFSYICCNPIASIEVRDGIAQLEFPDGSSRTETLSEANPLADLMTEFAGSFEVDENPHKFIHNGLFGFMGYDAVQYFEDIKVGQKAKELDLPQIYYAVYQNVIAINHFNNQAFLFAHCYQQEDNRHLAAEKFLSGEGNVRFCCLIPTTGYRFARRKDK